MEQNAVLFEVVSEGKSVEALLNEMVWKGIQFSDLAAETVSKPDFVVLPEGSVFRLTGIRGDEFPNDEQRTTSALFQEAEKRGYQKVPAYVVLLLRLKYTVPEFRFPFVIPFHEPILLSGGYPGMLGMLRFENREFLYSWCARPGSRWGRQNLTLFLLP